MWLLFQISKLLKSQISVDNEATSLLLNDVVVYTEMWRATFGGETKIHIFNRLHMLLDHTKAFVAEHGMGGRASEEVFEASHPDWLVGWLISSGVKG